MRHLLLTLLIFVFSFDTATSQYISDSAATEIGTKIAESIINMDDSYMKSLINTEDFFNQYKYSEENNPGLTGFNDGYLESIESQGGFGNAITENIFPKIKQGGLYSFLKQMRDSVDNPHLLFRFYADGAINYHDYELYLHEDGDILIKDIYIYIAGQTLGETLKQVYLSVIAKQGYAKNSKNWEASYDAESIIKLLEVRDLIYEGEIKKARKVFNKEISAETRNSVIGSMYAIQLIDLKKNNEAYLLNLENIYNGTGNHPSIYLGAIDALFLAEKYSEVITNINKLKAHTEDSLLNLYAASSHLMLGNVERSIALYEQMIERYPYIAESYPNLLAIYDAQEDYDIAMETIVTMKRSLNLDTEYLNQYVKTNLKAIAKSEAYKIWYKKNKE